jgi:glucose-6-phosphate isomerase
VPGSPFTFGMLQAAQATGDCQALTEAGRSVLRIHLGASIERGLQRLVEVASRIPKPGTRAGARRPARAVRAR